MITVSGRQIKANSSALNPAAIHTTRPITVTPHPTSFVDSFCLPIRAHEKVLAVKTAVERVNIVNMTPFGSDLVDSSKLVLGMKPEREFVTYFSQSGVSPTKRLQFMKPYPIHSFAGRMKAHAFV